MKYYIEWDHNIRWNRSSDALKITKTKPNVKKILKSDGNMLCQFCMSEINDNKYVTVIELEQNLREVYILTYGEDGGGGSYHSQCTVIVCTSIDEIIEHAKHFYDCEHIHVHDNCDHTK